MSFLYPRTITITRPNPATGFGSQPYSGLLASDETQILPAVVQAVPSYYLGFFTGSQTVASAGIPASIQNRRKGMSGRGTELPSDAGRTDWAIFIPKSQAALGQIAERDIVTDDLGKRYQVAAAWWDSLGYQLVCTLLQI